MKKKPKKPKKPRFDEPRSEAQKSSKTVPEGGTPVIVFDPYRC